MPRSRLTTLASGCHPVVEKKRLQKGLPQPKKYILPSFLEEEYEAV